MPFTNNGTGGGVADEENVKEQMSKTDTIKLRNRHIGKSCQLFYRTDPLKIVRGQGQYMFDEEGTKYLDCINNVAHVGHCHPKVVQAGCLQMATLSTNNRFLHDELVQCAKTLSNKMPGELSVCFFVNSGSEANDLALRLARNHTKQNDIITLDHAYHGHLSSVMDISPYKFNQPGGDPKPNTTHVAPCPDIYRGKYQDKDYPDQDLGKMYSNDIEEIITKLQDDGKGLAGFISESLQSCGGQIIPPNGYFRNIYKLIRSAGGVCIADEVQVGFGRVGSHYWAFETQDVIPDIVTIAKPMGNGYPVGAVITTPEIADSFAKTGICYFNTYGGNPVSCAIANAVMRIIDDENLQQKAFETGKYLLKSCEKLKYDYNCVGDIRGLGLFIGIDLVKNKRTREPATKSAKWIVDRMKQKHKILISSDGPCNNVVKLKPPMVFNCENADEFILAFRECLTTLENDFKHIEIDCTSTTTTTNGNSISYNIGGATNKIHTKTEHLIKSV